MAVAYSSTEDLLTGNIPTPQYLDLEKYVQDATDEIDSQLGHIFETPFNLSGSSDMSRPARLLIKRINNFLASGRLILAVASPEEQQSLHAYGWSLVREAQAAIAAIAAGDIKLEGASLLEDTTALSVTTPLISNLDSESNVEAFYNRVANPYYRYPPVPGVWSNPDRLVD